MRDEYDDFEVDDEDEVEDEMRVSVNVRDFV